MESRIQNQALVFDWLCRSIFIGITLLILACGTSRRGATTKDGKLNFKQRILVTTKYLINDHVFIRGGAFTMGVLNGTDTLSYYAPQRVQVASFYLKKYEVTNNEYRQFVHWVRDSIAHTLLDHFLPPNNTGERLIDWSIPIDWDSWVGDELYYSGDSRFSNNKQINTYKIVYNGIYIYPDTIAWVRDFSYAYNEPMVDNYFWHPAFDNYPVVGINYSMALAYCDWLTQHVFKNKYPPIRLPTEAEWEYAALGISPKKAKKVKHISERRVYPWEGGFFAANKESHELSFNSNSGPLDDVNYEYQILGYPSDGFLYTGPVKHYKPNGFGLYQMAGNVSEWVDGPHSSSIAPGIEENIKLYEKSVEILRETNGEEQAFWDKADQVTFLSDIDDSSWTVKKALNYRKIDALEQMGQLKPPFFADSKDDKALVKGGSWADPPFYLQAAARKMEALDSLRCFIGFRTAMSSAQSAFNPKKKIRKKKASRNKMRKVPED